MIKNRCFIVFSDDWGRHPFSCQHVMKHFLPDNRIIWVNTIGMRKPRLSLYDIKRAAGKLWSWLKPDSVNKSWQDKNLTLTSPFMIPYNRIPLIRSFNQRSVIKKVIDIMEQLEFSNPILITSLPNATDYIGGFNEVIDIYYCVDEFSEWPGVDRDLAIEMERELLDKVDFVVAVSDELKKNKRTEKGPTYLLTHGVDITHFEKASQAFYKGSNDVMKRIPKPIIGYFGLFDERSNQNIMETILNGRPEWSLVVIGRSVTSMSRLEKYKNFYHIDEIAYEELPNYAAKIDVCIIPYLINTLTKNINPLKLKEYLATGKPVVSTALPEAVKLREWIKIGTDENDFVIKVEEWLKDNNNPEKQIAAVRNEDWHNKTELFSSWIEEGLKRKACNQKCL